VYLERGVFEASVTQKTKAGGAFRSRPESHVLDAAEMKEYK